MTSPFYAQAQNPTKIIFERRDALWMRLVKYADDHIGIQVCPLKIEINGAPVWQDYNDSAPANVVSEFFTKLMDIDLVAEVVQLRTEVKKITKEKAELLYERPNTERTIQQLKEQIADQRNRIDTLDGEVRKLRRVSSPDVPVPQDGVYR